MTGAIWAGGLQAVDQVDRGAAGADRAVEEAAQAAEIFALDRQARRHGVAATLDSRPSSTAARTILPMSKPLMERPEPVPLPLGSKAIAKAGRLKLFLEARGDQPDDAGMPFVARR
jgi:hypothetical protein